MVPPILAIGVAAILLTVGQHAPTLGYGFYYDDYHFLHPYSAAELRRVFHGTWDPAGIEVSFYRPLTIAFFAARFAVFGVNASACHALSLGLFGAAAFLAGAFAFRTSGGLLPGLLTCAVFIVHPGMPYSAVAWITNQMHCLQLLIVLAGLHWWFTVRRRAFVWWLPLVALQAAALLVKEDGVMLLPAVVLLHVLQKLIAERDLPYPPLLFLATAASVIGGLLIFRASVLHGIGGYQLPTLDRAWLNVSRGLSGILRLVPARRPWQPAASWFVTLLPLCAVLAWQKLSAGARFGMAAGLTIAVLFDLPFVFVVKAEQLYLVTAGASFLLAASAGGLLEAARGSLVLRALTSTALVVGLVLMAAVARDIARDFEPYAPGVLRTDTIVREWMTVPSELRDYLAGKAEPAPGERVPSNPVDAVDLVAFGLRGFEPRPGGEPFRWMAVPTARLFVRRTARLVTLAIRHEAGVFREPAHVTIVADERTAEELTLTDGTLRQATIVLRPRDVDPFLAMHDIQIRIDHVWVPAEILPGSNDRRSLGLQIGPITVR